MMPHYNQSSLIERLLLKSWQRRLISYCATSSEGVALVAILLISIIGVDVYAVKSFNSYLSGLTYVMDTLLRGLGPLLFGLSQAVVWIFFMLVAKSNPPKGMISLPFLPEDWHEALKRIIYYCSAVILGLIIGPYLIVFCLHAPLGWLARFDLLVLAIMLMIGGALLGSLAARLINLLALKLQTLQPQLARQSRYFIFAVSQVLGIVLYIRYVFLVPMTKQITAWVPGQQLWLMYRELKGNHAMAALSYVLLMLLVIYAMQQFYNWLCQRAPETYWLEEIAMRTKFSPRLPTNSRRYRATIVTSLRAMLRDGETMLMCLATLAIPITLGVLLKASHRPDLGNLYTQLVWILLPLAAANAALMLRSKLGVSRIAVYSKPITPGIVVVSQLLVVCAVSVGLGLAGLGICAKLASLSLGSAEVRQFCLSALGAGVLAYAVGLYLGDNNRALNMLAAGTIYFVALMPFLALNQWLTSKSATLQMAVSLMVLGVLAIVALSGERQRLQL